MVGACQRDDDYTLELFGRVGGTCDAASFPARRCVMAEVARISAEDARRKVQSGQALLVCAYEDEAKCGSMRLEGAMTLAEFKREMASLPKDREIILYCA
jgi:hypothetical protein